MMTAPAENTRNQTDTLPDISLLGVKVHTLDMQGALDAIVGFVRSGEPHMVVTADASMVVTAQSDEDFRGIVNNADMVTPDGSGILLGAKWLGTPIEHKVSGVEVARRLCGIAAHEDFSVYLFGAAPGIAEAAAGNLEKEFPGLVIAGTRNGFFASSDEPGIVAAIRDSGAKVLLVAMGIPKQEKWIRDHLSELGVCVAIGVGGSFDVFSGQVKRAPVWMQRRGLEWLYRLAKNPRKISKVATLPRFILLVLRERFRRNQQG